MAREAERTITEIKLFKQQTTKAEQEAERCRREVMEIKEHSLRVESERSKGGDVIADRFEKKRRELETEHREEVHAIQLRLQNKEADLYKMEQLLLKMNFQMDEANKDKENIKIEMEMHKIEKIRLEERTNFMREQQDELKSKLSSINDEYDKKLNSKQMEIWKQDMTIRSLTQQMSQLTQEIERLSKAKDLSESIARMPMVCFNNLNTAVEMQEAKESALSEAVD